MNILWDVMKQCDKNVEGRKQVIVAMNKEERSCIIIDLSVSRYTRISKNENTKVEKELSVRSENPKESRNIKNKKNGNAFFTIWTLWVKLRYKIY